MNEDLETRFVPPPPSASGETCDHSGWLELLAKHVSPGGEGLNRVDYASMQRDAAELAVYIEHLQRTDVSELGWAEQFAYWANLYNALTVKVIADRYPVASIRDISLGGSLKAALTGGPWKAKIATVNGLALSLDDIEHSILRGLFKDKRLHYAINCGSIGCPNLRITPFVGASLHADLDAAARDFINSPRGVAVMNDSLVLSSIFKWYRHDFGGDERAVLRHILEFADADRRAAIEKGLRVDRYDYDWRLNGIDA